MISQYLLVPNNRVRLFSLHTLAGWSYWNIQSAWCYLRQGWFYVHLDSTLLVLGGRFPQTKEPLLIGGSAGETNLPANIWRGRGNYGKVHMKVNKRKSVMCAYLPSWTRMPLVWFVTTIVSMVDRLGGHTVRRQASAIIIMVTNLICLQLCFGFAQLFTNFKCCKLQ